MPVAAADQTVISSTGKTPDKRGEASRICALCKFNSVSRPWQVINPPFYHHYAQSHGADQLAAAYHCLHSTNLCLIRGYRK